jgi:hypothetical protein
MGLKSSADCDSAAAANRLASIETDQTCFHSRANLHVLAPELSCEETAAVLSAVRDAGKRLATIVAESTANARPDRQTKFERLGDERLTTIHDAAADARSDRHAEPQDAKHLAAIRCVPGFDARANIHGCAPELRVRILPRLLRGERFTPVGLDSCFDLRANPHRMCPFLLERVSHRLLIPLRIPVLIVMRSFMVVPLC